MKLLKGKITVAKRNSYNTANSFSVGYIFVLKKLRVVYQMIKAKYVKCI